jgi:hypothetical protein
MDASKPHNANATTFTGVRVSFFTFWKSKQYSEQNFDKRQVLVRTLLLKKGMDNSTDL